jgi:cyclic beta-1,2-glucan synthetase
VLAPAADDLAHPAFGKLFVESEYLPECAALIFRSRPRTAGTALWASTCSPSTGDRRDPWSGRATAHASWAAGATSRIRRRSTAARSAERPGAVLDPIASLRQRLRLAAGGFGRLAFATGVAESREAAFALAHKYRDAECRRARLCPGLRTRAERPAAPRHLQRRSPAVRAAGVARAPRRRLAARRTRDPRREQLGQEGLWPHAISGDLPILLVRVLEGDDLPLVRQVLQAQEYWRLKGLSPPTS